MPLLQVPQSQWLGLCRQCAGGAGAGEDALKKFASSAGTQRCFCGHCGSPVISIKAETPDFYRLRIGTLDTPLAQRPVCHIFTASKAEWEQIADDLPQYAERPESL